MLALDAYFDHPGDGRISPLITAEDLIWGMRAGTMLRIGSALGTARIIATADTARTGVTHRFCDDAFPYFTERLDVSVLRKPSTIWCAEQSARKLLTRHRTLD